MKKLILLSFLVFGQFIANAQKQTKKAQQTITLQLLPAGPVHLPRIKDNKGNGNGKDKNLLSQDKLVLSEDKHVFTDVRVIDTVIDNKNNPVKSRSVVYTISSL
ncbi:MAG TPA: hypothetical protein VF008_06360 [Niastella sp.]